MFWVHSTSETKALLVATLLLFSGFALVLGNAWHEVALKDLNLTANSVGVFAGVPGNEVNTSVAELDARERELAQREEALLVSQSSVAYDEITLLLLTISGFGMFGLILLNFYLDSRRRMSLSQVA